MIPPWPALGHRSQRGVGEPQHRGDQYVEHGGLGVGVVVEEALLEPEPRVVDQQLHRTVGIGQPSLDPRQLPAVGEVGRQHLDLYAVLSA